MNGAESPPEPSAGHPTAGMSSEEVRVWLRSASAREVYAELTLASVPWTFLIAREAGAAQLTAEVLWTLLEEQGGREGLRSNPAFQEAQVALLMEGAADDLERYAQVWRDRQGLPSEEESWGRVRCFEVLMEDGDLPAMVAEHPSLQRFLEALQEKEAPNPVGLARCHLASTLLEQPAFSFAEAQLEALARAFPEDAAVMSLVIRRARTVGPIGALLEGIPAMDRASRRIWASEVIESPSGIIRQAEARSLVWPWAEGSARERLFQVELEEAAAESYPRVLARLGEESPQAAARALGKSPPPAGTVLPRELVASLMSQEEPEARLALIRVLGSLEVSYLPSAAPRPAPTKRACGRGRKGR